MRPNLKLSIAAALTLLTVITTSCGNSASPSPAPQARNCAANCTYAPGGWQDAPAPTAP
ncbi:hypothetical protein [Deinococcus soli (ex Cha et al. 2016)]|uniref:Lipoprotein n=2 Tax=Deinococcus soli (ex Cha et al. 2016) TaxID=1309411 RepID=A0AAE3XCB6_9DEIO|nr:hypothetical protein [Deinococcus soli (ex Cha et al. 2016)]MDR6218288.1 hypothetical protein [Deinococcus soli (ex Cha et al. 2016)]MDR6329028.1 hypothetical protein [Deinococcus soli (ex Cha et al. 2016)]MDR6751301.1 hypothetical protein [Deinococcus soli (ex Cha et al. 2016)]